MAQGRSASSSDASLKTNASSASQVSAAEKGKFRTTSPEVCARSSRSSRAKTARANPCPVVDNDVEEHSRLNHGKSPAAVANNAGPSICLLANKRNNSSRNVATPTRRDVPNSTITPTSYLTINKNIKNSVSAESTCSRTRNCVASSSCLSEIEMVSTINNLNTRSNLKSLKSKHRSISTCRKSGVSRNSITTTVNNSNNISTISTSGLSSSDRISSTINTINGMATHTIIPLTNDNNFSCGMNNGHCSESPTANPMTSSNTISISPNNTIDSPVTSNLQQHIENGIACTHSSKHLSDGKMCGEGNDLVERSSNEKRRPELSELGSQSSGEVEANSELSESADGIDKHENSVPKELENSSATHMACNSTMSSVQCGSLSRLSVHHSPFDTRPDEGVSTMPALKGSSCSEVGLTTPTPDKSMLLPHQQRQQETCLHCGTVVEFILSHLVHSRRCQSSYDLETLEQVARRRSSGSFLSHLSLQTLDTIPSVGASVEVANDSCFQKEDSENFIEVEADSIPCDIESREHEVFSDQSDFDLDDDRVTDEYDDFSEPYFLSEDKPSIDVRNHQFTPMTNNNSAPWQPSSVKIMYGLPTTITSRKVSRKVKELSKASVMARKVLKMPAAQHDETIDLVNLVRLHSKGGVPIVMRKRKKTIQEEIEEEEMEERRRRPVITARIPVKSKFYHRRSEASNSASDEDSRQHCRGNHIGTAEFVRNKKRVRRLRESYHLNEVPFSEAVQTTEYRGETHLHQIAKDKPPDVWNQDLLLMQQKLLDFQKRLKVCERLNQTTLEVGEGNGSDTRKQGSEKGALRNASSVSDVSFKHDRLSGSLDAEHLEEDGSGRDFFEATEVFFNPEKFPSDRRRRGARDNARIDSKFGVKRKIVAPLHFNTELSDTTSSGLESNNNSIDMGNIQHEFDELTNSNEDIEEMPDYFDEDFLKLHCKMRSAKEQKRQSSPDHSSPPVRGRRIHIKRTECRSCGAKIKYILSHLSKSFKCQALYDMTLLRAQSEQNKKLRQRHYERQHKNIIKERQRQYYHDKREALRKNKRLYYQQNKDTYRERQSQYYLQNYEQQRERKRLYYIQNSERIRERHRRYNTVYRQREWNKRLQLDLLHYRREMMERGEDPDESEQVVEMTQHIMALPTDIEGIKKAMVAAGTFCGDDDEGIPKGRITIDSWRRNARAWVGGRRLLEAGKAGLFTSEHVPNARRGVARVKRLGNSKVIKLTKAGDATGVGLDNEGRGGGLGDDFMMAADQVIIEAVGDLGLGEEIQHDIEYVANDGDGAALVEEIFIQEEMSLLAHGVGPDCGRHHPVEDEVACVGEVQTEIHEDHNHVSFVQTLIEGESTHMPDENGIEQLYDGTIPVGLGVGTLKRRHRRHTQRGSQPRRTLNAKRASVKFSYRTTNEDNLDETDGYQTAND